MLRKNFLILKFNKITGKLQNNFIVTANLFTKVLRNSTSNANQPLNN